MPWGASGYFPHSFTQLVNSIRAGINRSARSAQKASMQSIAILPGWFSSQSPSALWRQVWFLLCMDDHLLQDLLYFVLPPMCLREVNFCLRLFTNCLTHTVYRRELRDLYMIYRFPILMEVRHIMHITPCSSMNFLPSMACWGETWTISTRNGFTSLEK